MSVPTAAFLLKLWKIVNDPHSDDLIKWSRSETSFIITNQTRFSQEILPKYFKHNNMASFVRQLNLYGFRKVISVETGALSIDKGELEFSHTQFLKGRRELIDNIKRKPQTTRVISTSLTTTTTPSTTEYPLSNILSEVQKLKNNQEAMNSKISQMKTENDMLWREYTNVRQKFSKQQKIIEKLVQFLVAMVKSPNQHLQSKWKYNHLALEGGESSSASNNFGSQDVASLQYEPGNRLPISGPVIHEVTHLEVDPAVCLEQVFQSSPIAASAATKPRPNTHLSSGPRRNEAYLKTEPLESVIYINDLGERNNLAVNAEPSERTFVISEEENNLVLPSEYQEAFDPLQLIGTQAQDNQTILNEQLTNIGNLGTVSVQSPNGTILETVDSIYKNPPLSPDLLQMTDPSVINPNIVVNRPKQQVPTSVLNENLAYLYNSLKMGHEKYLDKKGKFIFDDSNMTSILNSDLRMSSDSSTNISKGKLSSAGKKLLPNHNTNIPSYLSSATEQPRIQAPSNFDVAIPDRTMDKDELPNHVDDTQTALESLRELIGSSNLNVDTSMLLSLFGSGNEDLYIPDAESLGINSEVMSNAVTIYNPSLYDTEDVDVSEPFNFSSLVSSDDEEESKSPSKKFRSSSDKTDDEEGFVTPQPQKLPSYNLFNFKK